MKFLGCVLWVLNCMVVHAQISNPLKNERQLKYERQLNNGNRQMKVGAILLAAGYTSASLGFLTALKYGYIIDDWPTASTVLFVTGTAAVASGWVLFISGAIKKKHAKTQLKMRTSKIMINYRSYIVQPSVGIVFNL